MKGDVSAEGAKPDFHRLYFPHIDGLRALAIMAVVLYHFYPAACPGGFIGVDAFFVISGYLITGGIVSDLRGGRFSILSFYVHRIKRILPAYLALVAGVLLAAPLVFSLHAVKSIGTTALYSLLYSANVYFYGGISYFDLNARHNPLLHLWSLGVEEQFYLVVPLCIGLLWKARESLVLLDLSLLFAASLLSSMVAVHQEHSSFAFFMLPSRAWELLAGSILSLLPPPRPGGGGREAAAGWLGLALLLIPCALYGDATRFPGAGALPPVLGTALLIHCGRRGGLHAMLSWDPLVGIGKVSYSLYLWHWPIFVLLLGGVDALSIKRATAGIALSAAAAFLSWRFVELPVRRFPGFDARHAFALLIGGGALLASACLWVEGLTPKTGVLPERWNGTPTWVAFENTRDNRRSTTDSESLAARRREVLIPIGDPLKAPNFVLWGDSHALAFLPGVDRVAADWGQSGFFINLKHAFSMRREIGAAPFRPLEDREPVLRWLEQSPDIADVFLVNRWFLQLRGEEDMESLVRVCERLHRAGKRVFVFRNVPQSREGALRRLDWGLRSDPAMFRMSTREYAAATGLQDRVLATLAGRGLAIALPSDRAFWNGAAYDTVTATDHGIQSFYLDDNHLNQAGAIQAMRFVAPGIWGTAQRVPLPPPRRAAPPDFRPPGSPSAGFVLP